MAYVALRPCCFAGQRFKIGSCVPDDVIHPGAVQKLIRMQVIAEQNGETTTKAETPAAIQITVRAEEGDVLLDLTQEDIQSVFDVLTGTVDEAEPVIKGMTSGKALFLLNLSDSRKSIKAAAESRAKELNAERESEGEQ